RTAAGVPGAASAGAPAPGRTSATAARRLQDLRGAPPGVGRSPRGLVEAVYSDGARPAGPGREGAGPGAIPARADQPIEGPTRRGEAHAAAAQALVEPGG